MDAKTQLGQFLKARRARVRPADAGLADHGDRRRVPGLRREELAMLAGVSASYYTRLEQGHLPSASPTVLDAIAAALRLDESGRQHMHHLARPRRRRPREAPEEITDATRQLLDALAGVPALVLGRRNDVLAWNRLGHALFAGHLDFGAPDTARRPNMARLLFLDERTRELYVDWPAKAKAVVAHLRMVAGQHPDDAVLRALVGELSSGSTEFATWWADHRVTACTAAAHVMRHPAAGTVTVFQQNLSNGSGPTVVAATTEPGSESQSALAVLAAALR